MGTFLYFTECDCELTLIYCKFNFNHLSLHGDCVVPEKIHTHPMKGHRKFLGGGGVLKAKLIVEMYENKLEFSGGRGGGCKTKNLPWREYGYFLELHIPW